MVSFTFFFFFRSYSKSMTQVRKTLLQSQHRQSFMVFTEGKKPKYRCYNYNRCEIVKVERLKLCSIVTRLEVVHSTCKMQTELDVTIWVVWAGEGCKWWKSTWWKWTLHMTSVYRCTNHNGRVPFPCLEMENTLSWPSVVFVQPEQTQ